MIDSLLPSFLHHKNIARLGDGGIYITDRRCLPFEKREVFCKSWREAATAIKDMVTQGGGPLEVALLALLLASKVEPETLDEAVLSLSLARPTNTTMKRTIEGVMERFRIGVPMEECISDAFAYYDSLYDTISDIGEGLIQDGDGILTTCFPEHTFMLSVKKAMENGKRVRCYVSETRPYMQGAHLTEPCLRELGAECYLITDSAGPHMMREGKVQKYMTASDLALPDRTVVNKTGTLANAIAAKRYGIPYYAFSLSLDRSKTKEGIEIEYRSGEELKKLSGVDIASKEASALYPCFDIIDGDLVTGIITIGGVI